MAFINMKTFLISLFITFIMVSIPYMGRSQAWISPVPLKKNILEEIKPKLEIKKNNFELNKDFIDSGQSRFIPVVSAGSGFDGASAYALVDAQDGRVIAAKNLSQRLPMASLTKIMTAVVALDLSSSQEEFTVSQKAAAQVPTKVMLKRGEKHSLDHLLRHILISSANDSAQVIKEGIDEKYGEELFIKAMNQKAKILGLKNTKFTNPAGYDNQDHFSTVEDLSILSVYALSNYPIISDIVSHQFDDLTQGGQDMRFYLQNWNGLLGVYPGASGVKIGNTGKAGYTTIVASEREGKKLLAVLLGAPGVLERDLWTAELLDLGFNKTLGLSPVNITEEMMKEKYGSWQYFE